MMKETKLKRIDKANQFIRTIANTGRRFFYNDGSISYFDMDDNGRIWFVDGYSSKRIYTHCPWSKWKGFTNGGTMLSLVKNLQKYIVRGERPKINMGPWPKWIGGGDPWGYGDDMGHIRDVAKSLWQ